MEKNLDRLLSQLVEEIERVEVNKIQFGKVMTTIKDKVDLAKFPAIASDIIDYLPEAIKKSGG